MQDTKTQLLHAGFGILRDYGLANMSVQSIADKVGIRKASFFHHFKSLSEFYYDLVSYMEMQEDGDVWVTYFYIATRNNPHCIVRTRKKCERIIADNRDDLFVLLSENLYKEDLKFL